FLAVSMVLLGAVATSGPVSAPSANSQSFVYKAIVCEDVTRADGTVEHNGCSHNFFNLAGRNAVEDLLGTGYNSASQAFNVIHLCNISTGGGANPVSCYGNGSSTGNGLSNTTGTYVHVGGTQATNPGNWSISATFTDNTATQTVNGTLLAN